MHKFYGTGLVWDKENNKLLCEFKNGEYITEKEREIKILSSLEYKSEKREKPVEEKPKKKGVVSENS